MSTQPLSHHEILGLVEPFTRCGRAVDLAASDRLARRLAFRPIERDAADDGLPALRETLTLENPEPGVFRLVRSLALLDGPAAGLSARLQAEGAEPGELLARIDAVPPRRQFDLAPGHASALSHRLDGAALTLLQARARLDGLALTLTLPTLRGSLAEIELTATAGETITLPEDLLAVLGWHWTRLERRSDGWRCQLRLRGGAARSADAERKLARTLDHLSLTLAEPPARFHQRRVLARWGVCARRAIPLAVCFGLIGAAAAVPRLTLSDDSVMRMLILNAPPLLLIGFFCLREIPRIEIPPLPRRPSAPGWFLAPQPSCSPALTPPESACSATR